MSNNNFNFEKEYFKLLKKYLDELNFCRSLQKTINFYHEFMLDKTLEKEFDKYVSNIKNK